MGLFRRGESLHERLAREGGMQFGEELPPLDTRPRLETGIHGIARPRQWDAVIAVEAPALRGDAARFVALEDGTLVVEEDEGQNDLGVLADALDSAVAAPYRAEAVRRGDRWAVGARRIDVVEVIEDVGGDEAVLTVRGGERQLLVDQEPAFGTVPTLERLVEGDGVLTAHRLDGNLWEVRVARL